MQPGQTQSFRRLCRHQQGRGRQQQRQQPAQAGDLAEQPGPRPGQGAQGRVTQHPPGVIGQQRGTAQPLQHGAAGIIGALLRQHEGGAHCRAMGGAAGQPGQEECRDQGQNAAGAEGREVMQAGLQGGDHGALAAMACQAASTGAKPRR